MKPFLLSIVCLGAGALSLRAGDVSAALDKVVSLKDPIDAKLDLALTELADVYGLAGHIIVDTKSFQDAGIDDVNAAMVKLSKVQDVRLRTILGHLLRQVNGVYIVRADHIEIASQSALRAELNLAEHDPDRGYRGAMPLVRADLKEMPLKKALAELALQHERTIILAPQVGDKAEAAVTAQLVNVPLDDAVELLCEMADLKLVRKSNALFVTTPERAEPLLAAETRRREMAHDREKMTLERQKLDAARPLAPQEK